MRSARGLSLLEFLIALFLLLVILGGGMLLLDTTARRWFHGETAVAVHTGSRNLASFLGRTLSAATLAGDWDGARPEFVGGAGEISFCALISDVPGRTDYARVKIFFDPDRETLFITKQRAEEAHRHFAADRRGAQPLAGDVKALRFSYRSGGEVFSSWDSRRGAAQAGRLPEAVQAEFELYGPRRRHGRRPSESFSSLFEVRTAF